MMPRFSPELSRLLVIRGIARALAPIAVLWGISDWWVIRPLYALIFAALSINYVTAYVLTWVPGANLQGPWRIRPWQTFVLLINAFLLPIVYRRAFNSLPWGFIAITVLFFIGLYAATYIMFYLQDRVPMGAVFAARKQQPPPSESPPRS